METAAESKYVPATKATLNIPIDSSLQSSHSTDHDHSWLKLGSASITPGALCIWKDAFPK